MRVVCQQPSYFPWLGYLEQIARADSFVYLDDVQWIRQGRQHRVRVPNFPSSKKERHWLTVPVLSHGHRERPFREIEIDRSRSWPRQHWQTLLCLYGRAPFFRAQLEPLARPFLEGAGKFRFLTDLCEASVASLWKPLRLQATVWRSSDLSSGETKSARLIEICRSLDATEYYSALGASRYLDLPLFRAAGLQVRWQHFRHSAGPDPRRPCDFSVLDWVAFHEWSEIRARLGERRGTLLENALGELPLDQMVRETLGTMH